MKEGKNLNSKKSVEYKKQIEKAFELNKAGKIDDSLEVLSQIYQDIPSTDIKSLGIVWALFLEGNDPSKSFYCAQRAMQSEPNSPYVSLGLFHSLWDLKRYDDALNELERFLKNSTSEDHDMLLEEMREGFFENEVSKNTNPFELIQLIREQLRE
jgi:predicted Zn-dependent protease